MIFCLLDEDRERRSSIVPERWRRPSGHRQDTTMRSS